MKKISHATSKSPKHHRESRSPKTRRSSRADSRSPKHQRESRTSPVHKHRSHHSRHSRSRSPGRRHQSNGKEEQRKIDKLECQRKSERKNETKEAKDTRDTNSFKRSSMFPEDEALKNEKGINKHKKPKIDEQTSEKADTMEKKQDGSESCRDGDYARSTTSKSHGSLANDDGDGIAQSGESERHDKSRESHRKHDKNISNREKESSTSRSHKSRHVEENKVKDTGNRSKGDKLKKENQPYDIDAVSKEPQCLDGRQDEAEKSPKLDPRMPIFLSTEDGVPSESKHSGERKSIEGNTHGHTDSDTVHMEHNDLIEHDELNLQSEDLELNNSAENRDFRINHEDVKTDGEPQMVHFTGKCKGNVDQDQ